MSKLKLLRSQGWQVSNHDNHCQVNCGFGFPNPIKTKQQQMKNNIYMYYSCKGTVLW